MKPPELAPPGQGAPCLNSAPDSSARNWEVTAPVAGYPRPPEAAMKESGPARDSPALSGAANKVQQQDAATLPGARRLHQWLRTGPVRSSMDRCRWRPTALGMETPEPCLPEGQAQRHENRGRRRQWASPTGSHQAAGRSDHERRSVHVCTALRLPVVVLRASSGEPEGGPSGARED